jgi:hypothetical protein
MARSRGLVVRAEDSRTYNQEDVGSIPDPVYWMDVSVASYYIERKTNKGNQMRHTKKNLKKKKKKKKFKRRQNCFKSLAPPTEKYF